VETQQLDRSYIGTFSAKKTECIDLEARQTVLRLSKHPPQYRNQSQHIKKDAQSWSSTNSMQMPRKKRFPSANSHLGLHSQIISYGLVQGSNGKQLII
jgi:hypothetical protein